jgi:predicted dienelactone hydrolase
LLHRTFWACAFIVCGWGAPVLAAGIQLFNQGPALSGAIWYPCAGEPKHVQLGDLALPVDYALQGVKDCPVAGAKLPLVVFSHGTNGWFGGHHDTAAALADAGFVVAAINHPGDSAKDNARSGELSVFVSRPADMIRLIDFVLNDWKDKSVVDAARIGLFGFSMGGYTGLALIGAAPDYARVARGCTAATKFCEQVRSETRSPPTDPRVLAAIKIPLQFWRVELATPTVDVDPQGTARVARSFPGKPDIHNVPASHFIFLAPCSPELAAAVPRICTDMPAGFDRAAFHREFNASMIGFFRDQLVGDGTAR